MNITVSSDAAEWYKTEMALKQGDKIRFFVRYGGCSTVQTGFSLGVEITEPIDIGAQTMVNEILFFIEEKDLWYFSDYDLHVNFNPILDEAIFEYSNV
jgi:uncharacterized protein YneR